MLRVVTPAYDVDFVTTAYSDRSADTVYFNLARHEQSTHLHGSIIIPGHGH